MFHAANPDDILQGKITDVYFQRTMEILKGKKINPLVKAEFVAKSLPKNWPWAIWAGWEEIQIICKDLPIKIKALPEGSVFYPNEPVMVIEGHYQDFCVYETAILGLMCQASGIATAAARFKKLAGSRILASFGARRMHPIIAPVIERNAYIGGCDGVSVVKSGENIGMDPTGTMPHALVLCIGSTDEAARAYDQILPPEVKRVILIDTFDDEKFAALRIAEILGDKLYAIRLDTPSSRRGNFYKILEEVRWELDLRGYSHVKLFVSGGIKEQDIDILNPLVDAYGIGTAISNAPVVDYSMDIVEIDGKPAAKKGKCSGAKTIGLSEEKTRKIIPEKYIDNKKWHDLLTAKFDREKPVDIRKRVLKQTDNLSL